MEMRNNRIPFYKNTKGDRLTGEKEITSEIKILKNIKNIIEEPKKT